MQLSVRNNNKVHGSIYHITWGRNMNKNKNDDNKNNNINNNAEFPRLSLGEAKVH